MSRWHKHYYRICTSRWILTLVYTPILWDENLLFSRLILLISYLYLGRYLPYHFTFHLVEQYRCNTSVPKIIIQILLQGSSISSLTKYIQKLIIFMVCNKYYLD